MGKVSQGQQQESQELVGDLQEGLQEGQEGPLLLAAAGYTVLSVSTFSWVAQVPVQVQV